MILVDTNVLSELMRASPAPAVVDWWNDQDASALYLSTITVGEIRYGVEILARGRRRFQLEQTFERVLAEAFAGRLLTFDEEAARHYGVVMGRRKRLGRPLSVLDCQIASIARTRGFAVATRNVRDFLDCGVDVIDPFAAT